MLAPESDLGPEDGPKDVALADEELRLERVVVDWCNPAAEYPL